MKTKIIAFVLLFAAIQATAQNKQAETMRLVDSLNRQVEIAVINRQESFLRNLYTDDFVFTHGSGMVDSKESWIKSLMDTATHYLERRPDSTTVELHDDIAIVRGKLYVQRQNGQNLSKYSLKYVRVYINRNKRWQMLSHFTTIQWQF